MSKPSYLQALTDAKEELIELDTKLKGIKSAMSLTIAERERVQKIVDALAPMNGSTPHQPEAPPPAIVPDRPAREVLWRTIYRVMQHRGRFTAPAAAAAVEEEIGTSLGGLRLQLVRNSLIRHSDIFLREGNTFEVMGIDVGGDT